MSSCHPPDSKGHSHDHSHEGHGDHCTPTNRVDYLLWGSLIAIVIGYAVHLAVPMSALPAPVATFSHTSFELINKMWWGLLLAIFFVGVLDRIPREVVMGVLGTRSGFVGILRATIAGVLLDLCNHGILVIGMKLYERGASIGQTIAFLVASPWNSFSLTLVLLALMGWKITLIFIVLSCVIAVITGVIFDLLVDRKMLPSNPHRSDLPDHINFREEWQRFRSDMRFSISGAHQVLLDGIQGSRPVMRWILFGIILTAGIRILFTPEYFESLFGPTLIGLGLTVAAATVIEVCSEGSTPIAADLNNIAKAPGNGFTFLMAGVSTDYTEIMSIKETTSSWRISLFLPLISLPQIIALGYLLNNVL